MVLSLLFDKLAEIEAFVELIRFRAWVADPAFIVQAFGDLSAMRNIHDYTMERVPASLFDCPFGDTSFPAFEAPLSSGARVAICWLASFAASSLWPCALSSTVRIE